MLPPLLMLTTKNRAVGELAGAACRCHYRRDEFPHPTTKEWGEGQGENSPKVFARLGPLNRRRRTSNIQHPTSNIQGLVSAPSLDAGRSMLDVGCFRGSGPGSQTAYLLPRPRDRRHGATPHPSPLPFGRGEGAASAALGVVYAADSSVTHITRCNSYNAYGLSLCEYPLRCRGQIVHHGSRAQLVGGRSLQFGPVASAHQ